jgi:ABC-type nitrate/sulfonate/bicarbonate transport system substrate-binding protein
VLLCGLTLLAAACGGGGGGAGGAGGGGAQGGDEGGGEAAAEDFTFIFPVESAIQYHPWFVAQELGYFDEEGLNVELVAADGSSAAIQQLISGQGQAALPSPGAFLTAVDSGQDLRWVYSYEYTNIFTIITTPEAGVDSLEGLRGQRMGISEAGGGEVPLVRAVLRDAGLTEGQDVELVPIGEGSALTVESLQSGEVQAYSSSLFDVAALEAAGIETVDILPEAAKRFPSNGIAVTAEGLESNADQLARFARAVAKGVVFSEVNPDAAFEIAAAARPEEFEDPDLVREGREAIEELKEVPEDLAGEPLGAHYRAGWEPYVEFLREGSEEEGALTGEIDLDTILDDSLLEQVNDFDRAAVEQQAEEYGG